jgi:hypothetical protein
VPPRQSERGSHPLRSTLPHHAPERLRLTRIRPRYDLAFAVLANNAEHPTAVVKEDAGSEEFDPWTESSKASDSESICPWTADRESPAVVTASELAVDPGVKASLLESADDRADVSMFVPKRASSALASAPNMSAWVVRRGEEITPDWWATTQLS